MNVRYTDRSKGDIEVAFEWYEKQRKGLGFDFLDCVEISIKSICTFPEMYQIHYSDFRGCAIRRFPFSIFYTSEEEEIIIHSVFNNRQDPEKRP
ncbi:MAG: type II toxin-antitoxin system RelE/ParE family toxin [Dethiobacter sp.]|jgi:plasmid stabilization system protein ParE|nr:type II toxin-antitoxin system RelE/ParE family toxin [Dethiobacter sp.]